MPVLSIIIPFYNSEKYIIRCLESIKKQTIDIDYEVILINDGSTDNSLQLCTNFIECDKRFKIYSKNNTGVADTRNFGLKHSAGEYILFLDSDDWIENIYFEYLNPILENRVYDLIFYRLKYWNGHIKNIENYFPVFEKEMDTKNTIDFFLEDKITGFNGDKLIRKKLFLDNNIQFPTDCVYEDLSVYYQLLPQSQLNFYSDKVLYNYFLDNVDSLSRNFDLVDYEYLHGLLQEIYISYSSNTVLGLEIEKLNYYYLNHLVSLYGEVYKLQIQNKELDVDAQILLKKIKSSLVAVHISISEIFNLSLKFILFKLGILNIVLRIKNRKRI